MSEIDLSIREALTTDEVCREYPISRSTLLRLRKRGKIGGERFGRQIVFLRSRIVAYLAGEKQQAMARPAARLPSVPQAIRREPRAARR